MNLCIHCTHRHRSPRGDSLCIRDATASPVDGSPSGDFYHCANERGQGGACGPDGRHFVSVGNFSEAVRDSLKGFRNTVKRRAEMVDGRVDGTVGNGGTHESPDQIRVAFSEAIAELTIDFIDRLTQQGAGGLASLPKDSVVE